MLIEEYEIFYMEPSETVASMQMRFVHIFNELAILGNTLSDQNYANKVFRSM